MNFINKRMPALVITLFLSAASLAFAALPQNANDMIKLIWNIVGWVFAFFIATAAIYLIIAAFSYLNAEGDAEKISKAKRELIYAVIAIVIASLSEVIIYSVASIVGATIKTP